MVREPCLADNFYNVFISDGKQARVAVKEISDNVADVGDKVQCVDDKVQEVIDSA